MPQWVGPRQTRPKMRKRALLVTSLQKTPNPKLNFFFDLNETTNLIGFCASTTDGISENMILSKKINLGRFGEESLGVQKCRLGKLTSR